MQKEVRLTDTYEAAWYIMNGAQLADVLVKTVEHGKRQIVGRSICWILTLKNVSNEAIEEWRTKQACANLAKFRLARMSIKRFVKKHEYSTRR